jgi:uncharacterized protein YegJ (DUF2314 family)
VNFELDDGETRHEEAPETFHIPPREQRINLRPGQLVKLIFRMEHDGEVDVERMWVIVEEVTATGYIGSLNNQPVSTNELQLGAMVTFGPERVIRIHDDE